MLGGRRSAKKPPVLQCKGPRHRLSNLPSLEPGGLASANRRQAPNTAGGWSGDFSRGRKFASFRALGKKAFKPFPANLLVSTSAFQRGRVSRHPDSLPLHLVGPWPPSPAGRHRQHAHNRQNALPKPTKTLRGLAATSRVLS